jgi:hypothetical protein
MALCVQLLLAGTNFGPLDQSQVIVVQHRYSALLHYTNTTVSHVILARIACPGLSLYVVLPDSLTVDIFQRTGF